MARNVLLVDKDKEFMDSLTAVLSGRDCRCSRACSAKEALQMLQKETFDAVITEAMLEDVASGFRMARDLAGSNSRPQDKKPRVLFVTAVNELTGLDFSERVKSGEIPADLLLHKPAAAETVADSLDSITGY